MSYRVSIERKDEEGHCGTWVEDGCLATAVYQAASIFSKRSLLLGLIANFVIEENELVDATYDLLQQVLRQEKASQKGGGLPPEVMELAKMALEE